MKRISLITFTLGAAALFAACGAPADNKPAANNTNAANATANTAAKPAAAAPTKEALMALEKAGWEAWKNRDAKWTEENYAEKAINLGPGGRSNKAEVIKSYATQKCEVKSFAFSDDKMQMLGADVAVLTFKASQDATCDGKKSPANVWSASVYVREGEKWKAFFYSETAVVDPKAPPPPAKTGEAKPAESKPDALTEAMLKVEKAGWDAWVARDPKAVESVMSKDFVYFSGTGRRERAEAIKAWSEPKCTGLAYTFSDPMSVELTKDVALITYKADVKGSCDGTAVAPTIWVASFDIKEGDAWKNAFYMDFPR